MSLHKKLAIDLDRRQVMRQALASVQAACTAGAFTLLPAAVAGADQRGLPQADSHGGLPLSQALARRRSVRRFAGRPLALAAVSQLLWAAQGITAAGGRRTAPSAGALYPIELHMVALQVDGLAVGVHRYLPGAHALQRSGAAVTAATLQRAALGQGAVGAAAAVVVIAAVESRTAGKYGTRAGRYVAFEAGAASQNLALQAAALGLGTVVIGGFDEVALAGLLALPAGEQPLVMMPIGEPP
jgi:SagB-type dehydrogenase family enzyme